MTTRTTILTFALALIVAAVPAHAESTAEKVEGLKKQIIELQNKAQLGIRDFQLCRSVDGFGVYLPNPTGKVKPGTEIYIYYEPVNIYTAHKDGVYRVSFTQDLLLATDDGKEILNRSEMLKWDHQSRRPFFDLYGTNSLDLGELPAGKYIYKITVHDQLRGDSASQSLTFVIE